MGVVVRPCQTEFPVFQRASVAFGARVAFIGHRRQGPEPGGAPRSCSKFPVTYPSYTDPNEEIARAIHAATYFPQTIYYDRNGKIVFDHPGPTRAPRALEQDIRRYALR